MKRYALRRVDKGKSGPVLCGDGNGNGGIGGGALCGNRSDVRGLVLDIKGPGPGGESGVIDWENVRGGSGDGSVDGVGAVSDSVAPEGGGGGVLKSGLRLVIDEPGDGVGDVSGDGEIVD